jgi:nitronate monooxygenase
MMTAYRMPVQLPIVQAPMAGGPSTAALAVAAARCGAFGFVAGGYLSGSALREAMAAVGAHTDAPFGVNLFVPSAPAPREPIEAYAAQLHDEAARLGAELGDGHWDDDHFADKIDVLVDEPPELVTFTFGRPAGDEIERLHRAGSRVGVTVTSLAEGREAADAGADLLVVQGTEAGGHQATFSGAVPNETPLLDLLDELRKVGLPMIATGGIMTSAHAADAKRRGAIAVQVGTALLCTPEAGTSAPYRAALLEHRYDDTVITRAFSGRYARGLGNRFAAEHPNAPHAYPEIHYLTRPLRAAATAAGDTDVPNLWAGAHWRDIRSAPAADIIRDIARGMS